MNFGLEQRPLNFLSPVTSLKILKEMGIPDHLTCLLRKLYAGQEALLQYSCLEIPWTEEPGGCNPQGHTESDTTEVT